MRFPLLRRAVPSRVIVILLLAIPASPAATQQAVVAPTATQDDRGTRSVAFTIEDALDMRTYSVADVTKDGRWIAATVSTRRDALGTDYFRDTDPTYVRDNKGQVLLIDATTGAQRPIFPGKETVKSLVWSPDGTKLALLHMRTGSTFEPVLWDRASGKFTVVKVPAGKYVAETSDIRWLPNGSGLVFSLRTEEWRKAA